MWVSMDEPLPGKWAFQGSHFHVHELTRCLVAALHEWAQPGSCLGLGPWASTVSDHYCTWVHYTGDEVAIAFIKFHSTQVENRHCQERRSMWTYFMRLISFPQSQGVWVFSFGLLLHFVSWASLSDRQVVNWPGTSRNIPTSHPSWIVYMWPWVPGFNVLEEFRFENSLSAFH